MHRHLTPLLKPYHRYLHCNDSIIKSVAILFIFFGVPIGQASALSIESFRHGYEAYAFPTPSSRLVKPSNVHPTVISVHCVPSDYCKVIVPKISKYFSAPWLSIQQVQAFDPLASISVEVISGYGSPSDSAIPYTVDKLNIPVGENEKVSREGSKNCAYLSTEAELDVIHAVIVANTIKDEKRYVSCIMLGLARSIGLNLAPTYEIAWSDGGALVSVTDKQFDQWMHGTARLITLHTNPRTLPGMTQREFEKTLVNMSMQQLLGE